MEDFTRFDLSQFKKGDKITVIKLGSFGGPMAIPLRLHAIFLADYAQYKNCIVVQGKLPRKRKLRQWRILANDNFRIYKGHIKTINTDIVLSDDGNVKVIQANGGHTMFSYDGLKAASPDGHVFGTY